jgi:hypothetical protein
MKKTYLLAAFWASVVTSTCVLADPIVFAFTGEFTLLNTLGSFVVQEPIASTLTYDNTAASGTAPTLTINNFDAAGHTATIYDLSLQQAAGTNYIVGNMLADWDTNIGIPISMVWDATGLLNAINYGLLIGDVISGTNLIRNGATIYNVSSAIPATDGLYVEQSDTYLNQGPAPLAMTTLNTTTTCTPGTNCIGNPLSGGLPLTTDSIAGSPMVDGAFRGLNVNFDIGSGDSLTVLSIGAVPLPAAVWLFGSGLLGLIGLSRRKKAA